MKKGYNPKIFSQKRKQKYPRNKFFSFTNANRYKKNFNYKDFRNSNSIHSSFKKCTFFGTIFKKSKLKYCSFNGSVFTGITFKSCNFNGSRFLDVIFDTCIFEDCKFQKCNFKNAKFINTYYKNSSFKNSSGLPLDLSKFEIKKLDTVDDAVMNDLKKKYINTNVEFLVNRIDISRLLAICDQDELENTLDVLKENKNIKNVTISHVLYKLDRNI